MIFLRLTTLLNNYFDLGKKMTMANYNASWVKKTPSKPRLYFVIERSRIIINTNQSYSSFISVSADGMVCHMLNDLLTRRWKAIILHVGTSFTVSPTSLFHPSYLIFKSTQIMAVVPLHLLNLCIVLC